MKDDEYYFHQTPELLAIKLIDEIKEELMNGDVVLEPFKGEGAFYNNLPDNIVKRYCEIEEGIDFRSYTENVDWVISNPPFRLLDGESRNNSIYKIILHFSLMVNKGMCFLINDYGLSTLTPNRLKQLNDNGLYINNIIVCNVKKWRGRYFFIIFKKEKSSFYRFIKENF